ncbi:hypothetical protein N4R57_21590 [Rhodobacteraceae bacterium D3-12]|nr:hypothetical protein N4R57_21590 [Rhodobacteraceae bacterium D3-12]
MIATNGHVFLLKVEEVKAVLLSRRFAVAIFLFCTTIAIVDPVLFSGEVFFPWRALFWNVSGWVVVGIWYGLFRAFARFGGPIGKSIPLPSALMIVGTIFVQLHFNYWVAGLVMGDPDLWVGSLYWDVIRYSVVAILFETAVASLLLPSLLYRVRRSARGAGAKKNRRKQARHSRQKSRRQSRLASM